MFFKRFSRYNRREKILFFIAGGLIFIFLVEELILKPLENAEKKLRRHIEVTQSKLKEALEILKRKEIILKDYSIYGKYIPPRLSYEEALSQFTEELDKIIQETGLSILRLDPPNPKRYRQKEDLRYYEAEIRAEDDLETILKFIQRVQKSKLLIKIDDFSLTPKEETPYTARMSAVVSIYIPALGKVSGPSE